MPCRFCSEESEKIKTTIGDHVLQLKLEKEVLNIRIERGSFGMTRPILISYCPFCGEKLYTKA